MYLDRLSVGMGCTGMGKKSKRKGSTYELKIAKIMSEWSGMTLKRTPLSGGWARENPEVTGDLVCVEPGKFFPLHVECKNNESWNWERALHGQGPVFNAWWIQATEECPANKFPILVFSQAYKNDWVMFDHVRLSGSWTKKLSHVNYAKVAKKYIMLLGDFTQIFQVYDFMERSQLAIPTTDIRQSESDGISKEI